MSRVGPGQPQGSLQSSLELGHRTPLRAQSEVVPGSSIREDWLLRELLRATRGKVQQQLVVRPDHQTHAHTLQFRLAQGYPKGALEVVQHQGLVGWESVVAYAQRGEGGQQAEQRHGAHSLGFRLEAAPELTLEFGDPLWLQGHTDRLNEHLEHG